MPHALDPTAGVRSAFEQNRPLAVSGGAKEGSQAAAAKESVTGRVPGPISEGRPSIALFSFLDYDGTLSEIVLDPGKACMSPSMAETLSEHSKVISTSIISGRAKEKVLNFLHPIDSIILAGSHGFDICGEMRLGDARVELKKAVGGTNGVAALAQFRHEVRRVLSTTVPCAQVEDNNLSVTIHTRNVATLEDISLTESLVAKTLLERFPDDLQAFHGDCVIEIRPRISVATSSSSSSSSSAEDVSIPTVWNKGAALAYIISEARHLLPTTTIIAALIIGDDTTDEDMFVAARAAAAAAAAGSSGGALQVYTVKVRRLSNLTAATEAHWELHGLEQVEALLKEWTDLSTSKTLVQPVRMEI